MLRHQHKIRKGLDTQQVKKKSSLKPFKNLLLGIPKNLLRIAIVLFAASFVYIAYILTNEQFEVDFLSQSEQDFDSKNYVHPFFRFLQQQYDPSSRFKNQYKAQNAYDRNTMFQIPTTNLEVVSTKKFYRYFLTQNAPLHIVDGCVSWPILQKWSIDYLSEVFGHTQIET